MSKFKVGDKVWFDKDKARKEGNAIAPGMCGWISNVPDGLLTISEFVCGSERVIRVKECDFIFSPDWLVEADECKFEVKVKEGRIKDVKFSGPATIVFWTDGTKTVVKCRKGDKFDPEKGIAMACAKKLLGNEDGYHKEIAKYAKTEKKDELAGMDTEKLRNFVRMTCNSFVGCTDCPCRISNGGKCFIIASANREQLSTMYRQFLYAGKLWKEERNA